MDVNINLSLPALKKVIVAFLHRFHVVIFTVTILGGLALMIFLLNNIVVLSSQSDGYTSSTNNASFDQATIQKIEELKNRNQSPPATGRSNPFVE